jgi:hypothetical protein
MNSMTVPGYQLNSIGWHGDDGKLYKDGQMFQQLPLYSAGDTIGIGLTRELSLFFVLNDHLILKLQVEKGNYFPLVSLRGPLTTVSVVESPSYNIHEQAQQFKRPTRVQSQDKPLSRVSSH